MNITLLGAGRVGKAIALDIAEKHRVLVSDIDKKSLESLNNKTNITISEADVSNNALLKQLVENADVVINAVPGSIGYQILKDLVLLKKNVVDISFFPEDALSLNKLAHENNVSAIVDCGVAPGMGNIILGFHNKHMNVKSYECLVGGLPFEREWPYEYKAGFSPSDVIEEYVRPARYVENSKIITKPALSDRRIEHFEHVGSLESFNTDGLRTLLFTMRIPDMIEKTLRYPHTVEYLEVLRESGFFSEKPIEINGVKIRPVDFASKLLFPKWEMKPNDRDFTVMRIIIKGIENTKNITYRYNLFDTYCKETETSSMARTTGYTCTAIVNLFLDKKIQRKGIIPPEYLGEEQTDFEFILDYLKQRGVIYQKKVL